MYFLGDSTIYTYLQLAKRNIKYREVNNRRNFGWSESMREIDINRLMQQLGFSAVQLDAWQAKQADLLRTECEFTLSSISTISNPSLGDFSVYSPRLTVPS
jgi:hypothetical protein